MKVKKMWPNMIDMIYWGNEPVAVIPWEEWEKCEKMLDRAELFLDGINFSDPPKLPHLCRYCSTKEYNNKKQGVIHKDNCVILGLRNILIKEVNDG